MNRQDTNSASTEDAAGRHRPAAIRLLGARALRRLHVRPAMLSWRALRNPYFHVTDDDTKDAATAIDTKGR